MWGRPHYSTSMQLPRTSLIPDHRDGVRPAAVNVMIGNHSHRDQQPNGPSTSWARLFHSPFQHRVMDICFHNLQEGMITHWQLRKRTERGALLDDYVSSRRVGFRGECAQPPATLLRWT
jgi:hypothetical protein